MSNQEYINEIKKSLKQHKYTYQDLADNSGIPLSTIKNIMAGKTLNPRSDTFLAINKALSKMIPDKIFMHLNSDDVKELDDICNNLTSRLPKELLAKNVLLEIQLSTAIFNIINETKGQLTIEEIDTVIELLNLLKTLRQNHN